MQPIDKTVATEPPSFEELFADEDEQIDRLFDSAFPESFPDATPPPTPVDQQRLLAHADELLRALAADASQQSMSAMPAAPQDSGSWAEAPSLPFARPAQHELLDPAELEDDVVASVPHAPIALDPDSFDDLIERHPEPEPEPEPVPEPDVEEPVYTSAPREISEPKAEEPLPAILLAPPVVEEQPKAHADIWSQPFEHIDPKEEISSSWKPSQLAAAEPPAASAPALELPPAEPPAAPAPAVEEAPIWEPPAAYKQHIAQAAPVAAQEQAAPDAAPTQIGEVITVFGCRGGCGATTVAVNLAGSLAAEGKEVCIVDLDVQLGDVLVTMDLDIGNSTSLVNLAREVNQLDPTVLKRRLVRHDSGVYVLAQGGKLEEIDETLPSRIPALLSTLARHFDTVIIDGINDFSELALSALDACNALVLVLTQDVLAVRRARRVIDICRQLEVPEYKIKPVINCYRRRANIDRNSVTAALSMMVTATIVEDEGTTKRSQTSGQLLAEMARRKQVTRDIAALAMLAAANRAPVPVRAAEEEPSASDAMIGKLATAGGQL